MPRAIQLVLPCLLLLNGCAAMGEHAELTGTVVGFVAGAAIGVAVGDAASGASAAPYIGGLVGGWLGAAGGRKVGVWLEARDRPKRGQAYSAALATGQPQVWSNPDNRSSGSVALNGQTWRQPVSVPQQGVQWGACGRFVEVYRAPSLDGAPRTQDGCQTQSGFLLL